ncbi:MAG: DUF2203 family protein [Calditrichota bacterium]
MEFKSDLTYTPELATKTLPLVRRIVLDILSAERKLQLILQEHGEYAPLEPAYRNQKVFITQFIVELQDLGCSYKELNTDVGLVEYPSEIAGEEVLLCWRSDEDAVTHYYFPGDTYTDRQPIPGLLHNVELNG